MKKIFLSFALGAFIFTSCENEQSLNQDQEITQLEQEIDMSDFTLTTEDSSNEKAAVGKRQCHSMQVLNKNLQENPQLFDKMFAIEKHTRAFGLSKNVASKGGPKGGGTTPPPPTGDNLGIINIPVIVHVLYSNSNENISDAQINSQIAVLNADFNATNSDKNKVPSEFAARVADTDVNFTLAQVIRKATTKTTWGTNDAMKSAAQGGSNVISPTTSLNIWICNIGGGILGYAQFPGGSASTDGVVISPQYFGTTGFVAAPFDGGRTATHEVGHYLNLRHIWGDGSCRQDDYVSDTPSSNGPNYGCPNYPTVNCRSNDMTMNYMDYVDDACMYMFSTGQKTRMRSIFTSGGPRSAFVN